MKKLTHKQLDAMLEHGRLACAERAAVEDLEAVLRIARSYESAKRPIPHTVTMRLLALSRHWKGHDIPASVVAARETWKRAKDAQELNKQ